MRRTVTARWFGSLFLMAALAIGGFRFSAAEDATPKPPTPAPAVTPTAAQAVEIVTDGLSKILLGGAPTSVADLKDRHPEPLDERGMLLWSAVCQHRFGTLRSISLWHLGADPRDPKRS